MRWRGGHQACKRHLAPGQHRWPPAFAAGWWPEPTKAWSPAPPALPNWYERSPAVRAMVSLGGQRRYRHLSPPAKTAEDPVPSTPQTVPAMDLIVAAQRDPAAFAAIYRALCRRHRRLLPQPPPNLCRRRGCGQRRLRAGVPGAATVPPPAGSARQRRSLMAVHHRPQRHRQPLPRSPSDGPADRRRPAPGPGVVAGGSRDYQRTGAAAASGGRPARRRPAAGCRASAGWAHRARNRDGDRSQSWRDQDAATAGHRPVAGATRRSAR